MSQFTVLFNAVDTILSRKSFAAHDLYIDAEQCGNVTSLVMRSNDKTIIGRTDTPENAELCFNDETGEAARFVLATSTDGQIIAQAAAQLIAFYSVDKSVIYSARLPMLGDLGRAVLPSLLPIFGHASYAPTGKGKGKNGWNIGSYHQLASLAMAREQERKLAAEAKAAKAEIASKMADLRQQMKALANRATVTPAQPSTGISAAVQASIANVVADAFTPSETSGLTTSDLAEMLDNPPTGMDALYASVREHINENPDYEAEYLAVFAQYTEENDLTSAIETLLAERGESAVAA